MVTFSIPLPGSHEPGEKTSFEFSVQPHGLMLAGSRNLDLPEDLCRPLVKELHNQGLGFLVGCAYGVDQSFRKVLTLYPYCRRTIVACAFKSRTALHNTFGLEAHVVVPANLPPQAALHRRTVWLARRAVMLVLFPVDPKTGQWGKGSRLAFNTAIYNLRPVFVAGKVPPPESTLYILLPGDLFGIVAGFWAVPYPIKEGGACDDV